MAGLGAVLAAGVAAAGEPPFTTSDPRLAPRVGGDFLDEGFEAPGVFPPVGWSYAPAHPTHRWEQTSLALYVRSGGSAARVRAQSVSVQDEKLVATPLDLQAASGTDLRLSFWWRTDPFWFQGANTYFQVHLSLDGAAWTEAFTLTGFAETGWAWRNTVLDLSGWAGVPGMLHVRFRYKGIDAADLSLDDVRLGYLAPPAPPENDDCAGAAAHGYAIGPAAGPFQVAGNTLLATNDYPLPPGSSCTGYSHAGRDVVWRTEVPAGHALTATMSTVGDWDDTLFLVTDCGDPAGSCLDGDRGFPDGATIAVQNTGASTMTAWLVVSGWGDAAGEYVVDGAIQPVVSVHPTSWGRAKSAYRGGGP
jgi:hypothetical protein